MRRTRENLDRKSQLTEVDNMLGKAIQLLPDRYSEEYNIKQLEEEEQRERDLTDKEKYECFEAWLGKRARYLKSTMSHLLKKKDAPAARSRSPWSGSRTGSPTARTRTARPP